MLKLLFGIPWNVSLNGPSKVHLNVSSNVSLNAIMNITIILIITIGLFVIYFATLLLIVIFSMIAFECPFVTFNLFFRIPSTYPFHFHLQLLLNILLIFLLELLFVISRSFYLCVNFMGTWHVKDHVRFLLISYWSPFLLPLDILLFFDALKLNLIRFVKFYLLVRVTLALIYLIAIEWML